MTNGRHPSEASREEKRAEDKEVCKEISDGTAARQTSKLIERERAETPSHSDP